MHSDQIQLLEYLSVSYLNLISCFYFKVNGELESNEVLVDQSGLESEIKTATQRINELNFEEDEDDQYCLKDLPEYACKYGPSITF